MNVLFLTSWYPSPERPGFGVFVKEHAAAVRQTGTNVALLAIVTKPGKGLLTRNLSVFTDENNVKTWLLTLEGRLHNIAWNIPYLLKFEAARVCAEIVKSGLRPDVIHGNVIYPAGVLARFVAKYLAVPYIITEHWSKVGKYIKSNRFAWLGKRAYAEASCITTVSQFLAHEIDPFIPYPENIKIVPNVIDSDLFTFQPKKSGTVVEMLAIMNLVKPKRPDLLVKAVAFAQKFSGKSIRLRIVGIGPMAAELIQMAKKEGCSLELLGKVPKNELPSLFHSAHFFLHASDYETFGVVVAEALSTGTPVIASNLPALKEMMDETDGLFAENNLKSWTDAIQMGLNRPWNHKNIAQTNAYLYGPKFVGGLFNQIYNQVAIP